MDVFRAEAVTKVFGNGFKANDDLTLAVEPGAVYGPTSGSITLGSSDLVAHPDLARQLCSYLRQAQLPIDAFKVREVIELTGRIRGGPPDLVRERASTLIEALDIGDWHETLGVKLSGVVKRLVGLAMVTRLAVIDRAASSPAGPPFVAQGRRQGTAASAMGDLTPCNPRDVARLHVAVQPSIPNSRPRSSGARSEPGLRRMRR